MFRRFKRVGSAAFAGLFFSVIISAVSCSDMYSEMLESARLRAGIIIATGTGNQLFYIDRNNNPLQKNELLPALPICEKLISLDYDHDGDCDIAAISNSDDDLYILLNNGNGAFNNYTLYSIPVLPLAVNQIASADLNYDGIPEFIITQGSLGIAQIYTPGGSAHDIITLTADCISIADLTGDGKIDFYASSPAGNNSTILINPDETGNSAFATLNHTNQGYVFDSAIHDIDNDGDNDVILITDDPSNSVFLYKNNGTGIFNSTPDLTANITDASTVSAADIDNDGDQDFYIGDTVVDNVSYYLVNNGNGSFIIRTAPFDIERSVFFDIDFDGDLDLIGTSQTSLKIIKNDGTGNFTLYSSTSIPSVTDISVFTFKAN